MGCKGDKYERHIAVLYTIKPVEHVSNLKYYIFGIYFGILLKDYSDEKSKNLSKLSES